MGLSSGQANGPPGVGMGEGQGRGPRPEEENETKFYGTKVRAHPKGGKGVIVGETRGPNVAGEAREQIIAEIGKARRDDADPLTGKRLPKAQREHIKQYFNMTGQGE